MLSSFQNYDSYVHLLEKQVAQRLEAIAFSFLADGDTISDTQSFEVLFQKALSIAKALKRVAEPGDRVLLLYSPGLEFLPAFLGCMCAGVVPVVSSFSRYTKANERLEAIIEDCQPKVALSLSSESELLERLAAEIQVLQLVSVLFTDTIEAFTGESFEMSYPQSADIAFLQYTSGSTGEPRGVVITHGNLLHNLEMHRKVMALGSLDEPEAVFVNWLPHFHQMGLVSVLLVSLGIGGRCYSMPPLAFIKKPFRWLKAISRFGGTIIGAPNFAYDLCSHSVDEATKCSLALQSLKVAFISSEPIHSATIHNFTKVFEGCGFRENCFLPAYGQAENTTLVTGELGFSMLWVNKRALANGWIDLLQASDADIGVELVSSGYSHADQVIVVVDPANARLLPDGHVGEICLSGGSVAQGYWNQAGLEGSPFDFRLNRSCGDLAQQAFLKTGDLGFLYQGHLYITGRCKELIIIRGRNLYPQDIERTLSEAHPSLREGRGGAFAVENLEGVEGIVCLQEVFDTSLVDGDYDLIARSVQQSVGEVHQVVLQEIVFVRRNAVPRTTSGKIARVACRENWLTGRIRGELARVTLKEPETLQEMPDLPEVWDLEVLEGWLLKFLEHEIGLVQVDREESLYRLGFDSLRLVSFISKIEQQLGQKIPIERFVFQPTISHLAQLIDGAVEPIGRSIDEVESVSKNSIAFRLKHKLISGGPSLRGLGTLQYAKGVRLLRSYSRMRPFFQRLMPNRIQLLCKVYAEVSPELSLSDFLHRSLMANLWLPWKQQVLAAPEVFENWSSCEQSELLEEVFAKGEGAILACTHTPLMGYIERLLFLRGREIAYLGHLKPKHSAYLGDFDLANLLASQEDSAGTRLALRTAQFYRAKDCLRRGGVVIIFPDDTEGTGGLKLPFFERMRPFRPGMVELASECTVSIFPFFSELRQDGHIHFRVEAGLNPADFTGYNLLEAYTNLLRDEWRQNLHSFEWRAFRKYFSFPVRGED